MRLFYFPHLYFWEITLRDSTDSHSPMVGSLALRLQHHWREHMIRQRVGHDIPSRDHLHVGRPRLDVDTRDEYPELQEVVAPLVDAHVWIASIQYPTVLDDRQLFSL